jgi:two-component system, OmpR family, response regulator
MRILIAEDEATVAANVANALQVHGYVPDCVSDGEDVWFRGSTEDYAAIILDLGLPRLDGLTILRRWRAEGLKTPVIVLSARGTWAERVDGIDSGADDYLPKPFEMDELVSRLRAVIRRALGQASSVIDIQGLHLDLRTGAISLNGINHDLTPLEFRLLHHLALHRSEHVNKEELSEKLYAVNHDRDPNAIEAIISRVRRKLGNNIIESKRGFGYRLSLGDA